MKEIRPPRLSVVVRAGGRNQHHRRVKSLMYGQQKEKQKRMRKRE
tara:strand:- start:381 stop:515 length:135 start_codon:yes stop_codon:yes gene_type:complete